MIFSPSRLADSILGKVQRVKPNLIHIHWVQEGFVQIETLSELKFPIVWTLHDSWPFSGGCHLPYDCERFINNCGACPVLGSKDEKDLSRKIWMRKKFAWQNSDITVVSPSRWLAEKASESSLFRDRRVKIIPNCLDLLIYTRQDSQMVRKRLGILPNKRVVFINASQMAKDPNKGEDLLGMILKGVSRQAELANIHLLIVGCNFSVDLIPENLSASFMGIINNDRHMAELYSAADLLLSTSRMENLSNTVMEAMACSVPSVVFDVGGQADLIDDRFNGRVIKPFDTDEFVNAISWCLNNERLGQLSSNAGKAAISRYSADVIAKHYLALYEDVVEAWREKTNYDHT
jgi:glycosyltransferase involved in cell wall biosynthesis